MKFPVTIGCTKGAGLNHQRPDQILDLTLMLYGQQSKLTFSKTQLLITGKEGNKNRTIF